MASQLDGILGQFELTKETLTAAALKVGYRKAALKHHPDKKGDIEVFKALPTMFNVLKTFVDLTVCASYSPANLLEMSSDEQKSFEDEKTSFLSDMHLFLSKIDKVDQHFLLKMLEGKINEELNLLKKTNPALAKICKESVHVVVKLQKEGPFPFKDAFMGLSQTASIIMREKSPEKTEQIALDRILLAQVASDRASLLQGLDQKITNTLNKLTPRNSKFEKACVKMMATINKMDAHGCQSASKIDPPSASKTDPPQPLNMTSICSVNYGF